jgi:hypothetical protein
MLIRMRARWHWQNAGHEEVMDAGVSYDVPTCVAVALVAGGLGDFVVSPVEAREMAVTAPQETGMRRRKRR